MNPYFGFPGGFAGPAGGVPGLGGGLGGLGGAPMLQQPMSLAGQAQQAQQPAYMQQLFGAPPQQQQQRGGMPPQQAQQQQFNPMLYGAGEAEFPEGGAPVPAWGAWRLCAHGAYLGVAGCGAVRYRVPLWVC